MSLVTRINGVLEAPSGSYVLYSLAGGIFYVKPEDYPSFAVQWIGSATGMPLTMDLASAAKHSVILDLDYRSPVQTSVKISPVTLELIESVLKMTFIPAVPNFTFIIACRANHAGIHIHLPEFVIGYDDYIHLCESLQLKLKHSLKDGGEYTLDILKNAMLSGASKPSKSPYQPIQMVYVDELNSFSINLLKPPTQLDKLGLKRRKDNERSLFRYFSTSNPKMWDSFLKNVMMPVVTQFEPEHTLSYHTIIGNTPGSSEWKDVATFTDKKNETGYISKSKRLTLDSSHLLKIYHHLKLNAGRFVVFETNNHALKMWHKWFAATVPEMDHSHIPERFLELHQNLQLEHPMFVQDPNPLKTVLQYNNGYYFLPVFYALCQYYQITSHELLDDLYSFIDSKMHPLLERIRRLDTKTISYTMTGISLNTLHFCGNNLYERPKTMRDKLKLIVRNNQRAILSVTTAEQLVELLRSIQERHFPILVLRLRNALKKPSRFIWNFLTECWQEISQASEITDHMANLWSNIKSFLNQYRQAGGVGGPEPTLVDKFAVAPVVSAIMSDTTMERKDIQMDMHKWLIRLSDGGALDLLTGHIGGVVPELFLSDRKVGVKIPRKIMMTLLQSSTHLDQLYCRLTDKSFFFRYLKKLFTNETDNLFQTLYDMLMEEMGSLIKDPLAISMLHFYIHICKYMAFEYDMLIYLLDILSSVFIATNYERKFFVWKGLTRNGKSKLFELMGSIMGGYYHSIQSENLSPNHSVSSATPELASTLFSCRMVTSEELDGKLNENRVKQITGNSFVTFRNMYEQNTGGIPTAKLFATTNNYPECKASAAFKDRVVAIPFDADFVDKAPNTTAEQVSGNIYDKDAYIVEQSSKGGFFLLYFHLKHHINLDDGLLHYHKEPEYVVEFTQEYLFHTDIYIQFKVQMDVQVVSGCMTTMNDVKSAVRQFLKQTKNTSFHETDLFIRFEEEFGEFRRTDIQLGMFKYTNMMDQSAPIQFASQSLAEGEPSRKSLKLDDEPSGDETDDEPSRVRTEDGPSRKRVRTGDGPSRKRVKTDDKSSRKRSINDGKGPISKKFKLNDGSQKRPNDESNQSMVYYEGIIIKNLKKTNLDNM